MLWAPVRVGLIYVPEGGAPTLWQGAIERGTQPMGSVYMLIFPDAMRNGMHVLEKTARTLVTFIC